MPFELDEYGYPIRKLPDGRMLVVTPLTFGRARLHVAKDREAASAWYLDEF